MTTKTYVLYHAQCFDGSGAAFAAWAALGEDNVEYIPVQYNEPVPEMDSGSRVYIVDFSYPRDVLETLRSRMVELVILDHHKTAKEALDGFPGATFDMGRSGAVMAWHYFHPGVPVPSLLMHIQDRDLWQWKLQGTKEVMSGIGLHRDFRNWAKFIWGESAETNLNDVIAAGKVKLAFDEQVLDSAIRNAHITEYKGFTCAVLNTTQLHSEIGNRLCTALDIDFSLTYFIHQSGDVVFSFRSVGDFDVSVLAKALGKGGGGHRNASGTRVAMADAHTLLQDLYRD